MGRAKWLVVGVVLLILTTGTTMYLTTGNEEPPQARSEEPPETVPYPPEVERPNEREVGEGQLGFAGYAWNVRTGGGAPASVGSWGGDQVYVREDNALVLQLSQSKDGEWLSGEVFTEERGFGYGTYTWSVESRLDTLDPSVVLGFFTYDGTAPGFNEIDIEATSWGDASRGRNHIYYTAFEPSDNAVGFDNPHEYHWRIPAVENTTHAFTWDEGRIVWTSWDSSGEVLGVFAAETPLEPRDERVHINLWIHGGTPPTGPVEVVVTDFSFTPAAG